MYEIVNVIYGVVLDDDIKAKLIQADPEGDAAGLSLCEIKKLHNFREYCWEEYGFTELYHGNTADMPAYFGIELDSWGCFQTRSFVNWEKNLTEEQKDSYNNRLENYKKDFPTLESILGRPGIYYLGSSS